MKITDVQAHAVWGGHRNFLFVTVDTDEGISGVGETGITGRELAVIGAIEHFKPLLVGLDPMRAEHISQLLYRGGFFPAQRILGTAIAAIDIALWDIKGKALGVPVYELLGGLVRDKVVCYPHNAGGHGMAIESLVESCLQTKEEGWKFVRWGLPNDGRRWSRASRCGARWSNFGRCAKQSGTTSRFASTCIRAWTCPTR
jgi:galactonate dehydratase